MVKIQSLFATTSPGGQRDIFFVIVVKTRHMSHCSLQEHFLKLANSSERLNELITGIIDFPYRHSRWNNLTQGLKLGSKGEDFFTYKMNESLAKLRILLLVLLEKGDYKVKGLVLELCIGATADITCSLFNRLPTRASTDSLYNIAGSVAPADTFKFVAENKHSVSYFAY